MKLEDGNRRVDWEVGFGGDGSHAGGYPGPLGATGGGGGVGGYHLSSAAPHDQDHSYTWLSSASNISNFDDSGGAGISNAPASGEQ
jgi:hypothetical protein